MFNPEIAIKFHGSAQGRTPKLVFAPDIGLQVGDCDDPTSPDDQYARYLGNTSIVNIIGDHIAYINDGLGVDTYAVLPVLESIEERLKVVRDRKLGMLVVAFSMPLRIRRSR